MAKGKSIRILGIRVDKSTKSEVLDKVRGFLKEKKRFLIVTPNPEIILAAYSDPSLAKIINSADISIPDGVGLKLADTHLPIIKGRELVDDFFRLANQYRLQICLVGGTKTSNRGGVAYVKNNYPEVEVIGFSGPNLDRWGNPETDQDKAVEDRLARDINKLKPDLLFVAFGAPKQEFWVDRWLPKLNVGGTMVIGGTIDYLSGNAKLPPRFISNMGLEWLWRFVREPWRAKRIFNAVVVFPIKLLLYKLSRQPSPTQS